MKKLFLLWIVVFSAFSCLISQTIVGTFPCPPNGRGWGLEYIDGYLYMGDDGDGFIYKIDPATGNTVSTISSPYDNNHISYGCNHGLAWDGTGLWVAGDYGKDYLYKIALDGSVHDSIDIQSITAAVGGLAWDGAYLLMSSYYPNTMGPIYKIDIITGTVAGQIPAPGNQPYGLGWDGTYIWNGMDDNDGDPENIYQLDPADGTVLSQFGSPATSPKGIAFGGGYMWLIAGATGSNQIYQIDLGGSGTPQINLPVSFHDFGVVTISDSAFWEVTIQNTGDADLIIDTLYSNSNQFGFANVALPITISDNSFIEVETYFAPNNQGHFNGTLTIESNDPLSPTVQVEVEGDGVTGGPAFYTDSYYHYFGSCWVTGLTYWDINITNLGSEPLIISDMETRTEAFYVNPEQSFPVELQPLESDHIAILFHPLATGNFLDTLIISTNDPSNSEVSVYLDGNGYEISSVFGELLWMAHGIENVEAVTGIDDINGDDVPDACFESYDAGAPSDADHLYGILGNSSGEGIPFWSNRPSGGAGNSGGWGNQCLAKIGDLNGDGTGDILLGTAWGGRTVFAINGQNGESIWSYDTYNEDGEGGWVYAVNPMPDINGDSIPEVLAGVGSSNSGYSGPRSIYCFDGASGTIIWRYQGTDACISVHALDDVNDDGTPDAVAGFGGNDLDTRVVVVSGSTGDPIWEYTTGGSVWMVNRINDLNNDGINDVIAGSWDGNVYALSGENGELIWTFNVGNYIMMTVPLPDVNMDGKDEVIVANWSNSVLVVSGNNGSLLWSYYCGNSVWAVDWSPDLDADGIADVLAGDFDGDVMAIRGNTGELIWSQNAGAKVFDINWTEDVTGDGGPEVLAGTQMLGGMGGDAFMFSGGFSCWEFPGDVNDDGQINVIDITKIVCMILHTCEVEPCAWMNSDFNQDNDVNVLDIVGMVQYILNNPRQITSATFDDGIAMKIVSVSRDNYQLVLQNSNPVYGFQFKLKQIDNEELSLIQPENFQCTFSFDKIGATILGYSPEGKPIPPGKHILATFRTSGKAEPEILSEIMAIENKKDDITSLQPPKRAHIVPETDKYNFNNVPEPLLSMEHTSGGSFLLWEIAPKYSISSIKIYRKQGSGSVFENPDELHKRIERIFGNDHIAAVNALKDVHQSLKIEGYELVAILQPDTKVFEINPSAEEITYLAEFITTNGSSLFSRPLPIKSETILPEDYSVFTNYPNPFNPSTTIRFGVTERTVVRIRIYDVSGNEVRNLINKVYDRGIYQIEWDGKNTVSQPVSTGIYIASMENGKMVKNIKLVLIK